VLLLLSGPANAFDLTFGTISNTNPTQGDVITFTTSVEVNSNEIVPIQNLSLNFSDGQVCYFSVDGDILTPDDCTGLTITPDTDSTNYTSGDRNYSFDGTDYSDGIGFGYGYAAPGPSVLTYNITLNTSEFDVGELNFSLNAHLPSYNFASDEQSIDIATCVESWSCTEWSSCSGGTKTKTCTDANSCGTTNDKPATSQSCTSGGGGGGGGAVTNPSTSRTWDLVAPGVANIFKITNDDFGINEITLEVIDAAGNVRIEIIKLPGKPASVADIIGKVFKYLQIKATNLADANIKGVVKIKFQVTKSWLAANGIDASKIVLKRYVNNAWADLTTTLLSTDDKYAYYEAESPGFSYFAIAEGTAVVPTAPVPKAPETQTPATQPPAEQPKEQPAGQQPPATQPSAAEPGIDDKTPETKSEPDSTVKTILSMVVIIAVAIAMVTWISKGGKMPKMPRIFRKHSRFKSLDKDE